MLVDVSFEAVNTYKAFIKTDFDKVVKVVATLNESSLDKFWLAMEKQKPDVVVMDIRFFGLGTLRLIGEVIQRYNHVRLLITGTYDDYDYLRASMEYGATDYIYKPAKRREFELALGHIVGIFEAIALRNAQDKQMMEGYDRDRALFRQRFLTNLLSGVIRDEAEVESSLKYFGMSIERPCAALVLRIDHFRTVMKGLDEKSKHLLIYKIFFVAEQFLAENNLGYAFINSFNSIICIIGGLEGIEAELDICATLKDLVVERSGLEVTIGLGRPYDDLLALQYSAKEAEAALRYRYLMGYNTIIPIEFIEPDNNLTYRFPKEKEQKLVHSAVAGEYDYAVTMLREVLAALDAAGPLPDRLLPRVLMSIVIAISRYASELGLEEGGRGLQDFFNFGDILNIKTTSEALAFMQMALRSFCGFIVDRMNEKSARMVQLAKSHVDEYFYQDVSLENLALEYGTTGEFLGKVFAQQAGMPFKDYLTGKRIARAKEILQSGEETSEEIVAASVGFFDVRVFRSVFRRREGVFPMEYRRGR